MPRHETELNPPIQPQRFERLRVGVSEDGENFKKASAHVIKVANGEDPGIYLGKGIIAGFISGGEGINRVNGAIIKIDRLDTIEPDGDKLLVYELPE